MGRIVKKNIEEKWYVRGLGYKYLAYTAHNPETDEIQETWLIYDWEYKHKLVITKDGDKVVNERKTFFHDMKKDDLFYDDLEEFGDIVWKEKIGPTYRMSGYM